MTAIRNAIEMINKEKLNLFGAGALVNQDYLIDLMEQEERWINLHNASVLAEIRKVDFLRYVCELV